MTDGPSSSANDDHHRGQENTRARFTSSIAITPGPSAASSSAVGGLHGKRKADAAAETGILGRSRLSGPVGDTSTQHRAGAVSQRPPMMLLNLHKTVTAGESSRKQMAHPATSCSLQFLNKLYIDLSG